MVISVLWMLSGDNWPEVDNGSWLSEPSKASRSKRFFGLWDSLGFGAAAEFIAARSLQDG